MNLRTIYGLVSENDERLLRARTAHGQEILVRFVDLGDGKVEVQLETPDGEPVGGVDIDVWPQRKFAAVEWAWVGGNFRRRGVGTAVYPIINKELLRRYRIPLSSDEHRSTAAERLWTRLTQMGLAEPKGDRYVMKVPQKRARA